jgi:hypothetical protein
MDGYYTANRLTPIAIKVTSEKMTTEALPLLVLYMIGMSTKDSSNVPDLSVPFFCNKPCQYQNL